MNYPLFVAFVAVCWVDSEVVGGISGSGDSEAPK